MDGYLKIKTKIDNKDVDKGITELENKIKKLQEDNSKSSAEQNSLQKELDNYQELQASADRYKQKIKELNKEKDIMFKNNPALADSVYTPEYANIKSQILDMQQKYSQATAEIDKQAPKIEKVCAKLDKVKSKQTENNVKIQQFKSKIESIKADSIKNSINGIGKGISGQISKIGKMAMAVIGIRTAWNAVRRAVSLVSQYNPQIATDLQYMGYCIANLVAPAVQWLTRLLYTALSYINAIMQAWFGINIFANSSAKAFKKMQKSAGGTAKSSKEIQKSLQGFDEMNVLQDTNSNSSGGGSGVGTPSMDLSNIQGEIPEWLKWIVDHKDEILGVMTGVATGLIAWKLGLDGFKSLGIGIMVKGIIDLISSLKDYLEDPSWENFGKVIKSIGEIILGLGILIGNVPLIVAGAIILIVGIILKYWEQIKAFFQKGIDWLASKSDWIHQTFGDKIGDLYDFFVDILQDTLDSLDGLFNGVKQIFDGIIKMIKGVFAGDWKQAWEGLKQIVVGVFNSLWSIIKLPLNMIISGLNTLIRGANRIKINIPDWVPGVGGKQFGFNIPQIPKLAKGGIISQPTQAIIGEAGKEAVIPLENNMEWLNILADKLASKIGINGGSYIINMDGRVIQRGIAKRQQELSFLRNGR